MTTQQTRERRILEWMLILIVIGTACLFSKMGGYKLIALNLFYLPIILSGYYWGRSSACYLALFCVLSVTIVTSLDSIGFVGYTSPIMVYLSLTVWGAVLGLSAILIGTLCDERATKLDELHEAYVGVAEVLASYLQNGNVTGQVQSSRIAELCQAVAERMGLSRKETDDVRVGALLCDLGNVEITTRLISKAVSALEANPKAVNKHTFLGMELVHSLSSVLNSVIPLLASQDEVTYDGLTIENDVKADNIPLGVKIIRTVRAYHALISGSAGNQRLSPEMAIEELRNDADNSHNTEIIDKLQQVVRQSNTVGQLESAYA
ncbi:MAG: HD-GYP domain-containing protein [Planctomycetota bacterium]|jgi:hypothetical protein